MTPRSVFKDRLSPTDPHFLEKSEKHYFTVHSLWEKTLIESPASITGPISPIHLIALQVICYSDEHIEESKVKVNNLEKEYKAFVRKLATLTPGKLDAVPWTNRPYKRKNDNFTESQCPKKEFVPISTPILDQEKKPVHETAIPLPDLPLMNEPLVFAFEKETDSFQTNLEPTKCSEFGTNADNTDNNSSLEKFTDKNHKETKNSPVTRHQQIFASSLVNYDYSSESDS
ncbi:hypothetical protein AVEN_3705-1 [Araneus ventricosus]|uniref:Uncharacterized protein n=1 Tax=Araneus ventricosus TaxID=182803 RepID=A0A4Y2JXT1_ARAVE|nr:hypothetical protein AVEN_3705-1 [Araneus ventricosus]